MTVSDLKNKLLEVVRQVEKGEVVAITKDGEPVAVISPYGSWSQSPTGFGRVEVKSALDLPDDLWSHDVENLARGPVARRERKP